MVISGTFKYAHRSPTHVLLKPFALEGQPVRREFSGRPSALKVTGAKIASFRSVNPAKLNKNVSLEIEISIMGHL